MAEQVRLCTGTGCLGLYRCGEEDDLIIVES